MKTISKLLFTCMLAIPLLTAAQNSNTRNFKQLKHIATPVWEQPVRVVMGNEVPVVAPSFDNAQYPELPESILPVYITSIPLEQGTDKVEIQFDSIAYIPLTDDEKRVLENVLVPIQPEANVSLMFDRGNPVALLSVKPFGTDPETGMPAKLSYFDVLLKSQVTTTEDTIEPAHRYPAHSRMAYGDWFKMWIRESGIHRITYEQLQSLGMNMNGIKPDYISMFGRGGRPMDEIAGNSPFEDMTEISIRVVAANPDLFGPGDYILFYGEGPVTWKHNLITGRVDHITHPWADAVSYYITISPYRGKRIPIADPITVSSNGSTSKYTSLALYEKEDINLIKSGRKWFSHKFDNYTRNINLPEENSL